jgi:plastocyanin
VKTGLEGKTFAVPAEPVTLDQNGCMYKPHVVGIQARQNLKVVTSDDTTHNIHPMPKVNREWNVSQPPKADPIMQTFSRPEESIPVKCNQHPWMKAWIHVINHPYFAVTGEDGTYEIKDLPPGTYELEAVHEQYGGQSMKVTVAAKQTATADFSYRAEQAYRPSSLKIVPAMVLGCCGEK